MKPGAWTEAGVQKVSGMVIIAPYPGQDAQYQSARIERTASVYDGHPSGLAKEPYSSAKIRIDELHSVTSDTRNPANPPYPIGSEVSLLRGDGKAWWRHWGMMIDQREGTLLDSSANLEAVDVKHRLDTPIRQRALLSRMPYHTYYSRSIGLSSTWLVDKIFRDCGFNATPTVTQDSRLVVPMMGSMWPYQGVVKNAGRSAPNFATQPSWVTNTSVNPTLAKSSPFLGEGDADYLLTSASTLPETHFEFTTAHSDGIVYVETVNADGAGGVIAWDNTSGANRIGYGGVNSSGTRYITWKPRGTATRIGARFNRQSSNIINMVVRTDTGEEYTRTVALSGVSSGWAATEVRLRFEGPAPLRGLWTGHNPSPQLSLVNFSPTARIRARESNWWTFSRDVFDVPAIDVLNEMADALCGTYWIDDTGHAQWVDYGVFEAQNTNFDVNTLNHIDDWGWHEDAESSAQNIRLTRTRGAITSANSKTIAVWQGQAGTDFSNGESWEEFVNVPEEEDWIGCDATFKYVDGGSSFTDFRTGTMIGATLTNTSNDGESWSIFNWNAQLEELGYRSYKWTVTFSPGSGNTISLRVPSDQHAPNAPSKWRGKPMPVMRGNAKITTISVNDDNYTSTGNPLGLDLYEHDVGWYVQDTSRLSAIRTYLAEQMGTRWPVLTSIKIAPDPRIELGDKGRFRDPHVSHSDFDGVVLGMKDTWEHGNAEMELIVRPLLHRDTTEPVRPPLHWLQTGSQQWHYPD